MTEPQSLLSTICAGWQTYQTELIDALTPLKADQLTLRASPTLRSVGENLTHMVSARARWLYTLMGEGGEAMAAFTSWDRSGMPVRSAAELVQAFEITWQGMHNAMTRWSPSDWQQTYSGATFGVPAIITRQWIIWHLIEHDLHHGGGIAFLLGMHGLPANGL